MIYTVSTLSASAGFLVGNSVDVPAADKNDKVGDVILVIEDYNDNNDPNDADLTTAIALFKKTDDDEAELFDPNSDFTFWADPNMTTQITSDAQLQTFDTAYFTYGGPADLLYYSAKTGANDGFSVYTYMPGKNEITIDGSTKDISHVSFWVAIPEPATLALGALGLLAILKRRH